MAAEPTGGGPVHRVAVDAANPEAFAAREVLEHQRDEVRTREPNATATIEVEPGASGQAVVTLTIHPKGQHRFQVINIRDGRIVHIQDARNLKEARGLAGVA